MNVLLLSISDGSGGAARSAYRLHQGLKAQGIPSQMLVQIKTGDDQNVLSPRSKIAKGLARVRPACDRLPLQLYRQREPTVFSCNWQPDRLDTTVTALKPDIVHLHWIGDGYVSIETLGRIRQPLVWTLHDMWPFTGGCHYSQDCDRYLKSCGHCPQLGSTTKCDLSRWIWQRKARHFQQLNLRLVAPSQWLADCAKASSLFQQVPVTVIPNGLDLQCYKPIPSELARQILNLPSQRLLILFGAINSTTDQRKGFDLLTAALQTLSETTWDIPVEVVIFGASHLPPGVTLNYPVHCLGKLYDDWSLSLVYAAADVMVVPSRQEAFGQTASEALACGTPVVTFNSTGLRDVIDHQQTGYLAQPDSSRDLAQGIAWVLDNPARHHQLRQQARQKAEQAFSHTLQAQRYQALYADLLSRSTQFMS